MAEKEKRERQTHLLLEAENGMMVDVPEDRLESWEQGQEAVRNGTYKVDEQLRDKIVSMLYGPKK